MAFDGYHKWLGIPTGEQPPNHYRLLGIALFEADPDVIDASANRQMAYVQSCATGENSALSQRILNELAAARICLLDSSKRATYDAELRAKSSAPLPVQAAVAAVRPRAEPAQASSQVSPVRISNQPPSQSGIRYQPRPTARKWTQLVSVLGVVLGGALGVYVGLWILGSTGSPGIGVSQWFARLLGQGSTDEFVVDVSESRRTPATEKTAARPNPTATKPFGTTPTRLAVNPVHEVKASARTLPAGNASPSKPTTALRSTPTSPSNSESMVPLATKPTATTEFDWRSSPKVLQEFMQPGVGRLAISPDGRFIAFGQAKDSDAANFSVHDILSGQLVATSTEKSPGIHTLAFTIDGRKLIVGAVDWNQRLKERLYVWDSASQSIFSKLDGHGHQIMAIQVLRDGHTALTASLDTTICVWDLDSGRKSLQFGKWAPGPRTSSWPQIWAMAVAPDEQSVFAACRDSTVHWCNLRTGAEIATFEGQNSCFTSVDVSTDGKWLAAASTPSAYMVSEPYEPMSAVYIWDLTTREIRQRLELDAPTSRTTTVKFLPDNRTLAVGTKTALVLADFAGRTVKHPIPMSGGQCIDIVNGLVANIAGDRVRIYQFPKTSSTPQPVVPASGKITTSSDLAFQQWVKDVQALPAERQIDAVAKKLMELNPGFDGKLKGPGNRPPKIVNGVVTELDFVTDNVTDISPVRALTGLTLLYCLGSRTGSLSDLSPLQGMSLRTLSCGRTRVADLSPLKGMSSLTYLMCFDTKVFDLSPLQDCKNLRKLDITDTQVSSGGVADLQKVLPNCEIEWGEKK